MKYVEKYQKEYLSLLEKYESSMMKETIMMNDIGVILDDVNKFWLKRCNCVEKEIDYISTKTTCMILSGAIYLDYKDDDHYLYKALGKIHFIHDSLLKLETVFRVPEKYINIKKNSEVFRRAYNDELLILRNTPNSFYYVPINRIINKKLAERDELLNKAFWDIISSLFDSEIREDEVFESKYNNFEDIETALGPSYLEDLIFNDDADSDLSLRSRIDKYFNNQIDMREIVKNKSEPKRFLTAVFSYIGQVVDILIAGTFFNLIPFIRFNVTFHYFTLIMRTFLDDQRLKTMIEGTIITYIFCHSIDKHALAKIGFNEYCLRIEAHDYLQMIRDKMKENGIDIVNGGVKKVAKIIEDYFKEYV